MKLINQEIKSPLYLMTNFKSLVSGIGDIIVTQKYYDDWADTYEKKLTDWDYRIPLKLVILIKTIIKNNPKNILDLACGTGLFGEELKKISPRSKIIGSDISPKSIQLAKLKRIYNKLYIYNFEKTLPYNNCFDLVSMAGAMTYCKNFDKLFSNVFSYLVKDGYFIFSHRVDLWKKQNFDDVLLNLSNNFNLVYKSKPHHYLPKNIDFKNKIKVRLVLLQKN